MILHQVIRTQIPLPYQKDGGRQETLISLEGLCKVTTFKLSNIPEFDKGSAVQRCYIIIKATQLVQDKVRIGPDPFYFSFSSFIFHLLPFPAWLPPFPIYLQMELF